MKEMGLIQKLKPNQETHWDASSNLQADKCLQVCNPEDIRAPLSIWFSGKQKQTDESKYQHVDSSFHHGSSHTTSHI